MRLPADERVWRVSGDGVTLADLGVNLASEGWTCPTSQRAICAQDLSSDRLCVELFGGADQSSQHAAEDNPVQRQD